MKALTDSIKSRVIEEVKTMLHAHRDCLRNRGQDTKKIAFDCRDGYYGEAFGVMRGLQVLGYGKFESDNLDGLHYGFEQREQNLKWWFRQIEDEVLNEEGYHNGTHFCPCCKARYGKG
jgi:hypothetical protein